MADTIYPPAAAFAASAHADKATYEAMYADSIAGSGSPSGTRRANALIG